MRNRVYQRLISLFGLAPILGIIFGSVFYFLLRDFSWIEWCLIWSGLAFLSGTMNIFENTKEI